MKILFLGDSLVEFYNWQARFPLHKVINAGKSGETVAGLLACLPRYLRSCPDPEQVHVMIGTNNLLREDYNFLPAYGKILNILSDAVPPVSITVTSLLPMQLAHLPSSAIPRLNTGLLQLSQQNKSTFLNLFAAFNTAVQPVTACFNNDGVHLSSLGYQIWSDCLAVNLQ